MSEQWASDPASTGGAGTFFEQHVATYWLAQLLVCGIPPILIDTVVTEAHIKSLLAHTVTGGREVTSLPTAIKPKEDRALVDVIGTMSSLESTVINEARSARADSYRSKTSFAALDDVCEIVAVAHARR